MYRLAGKPLASQEDLRSVELVNRIYVLKLFVASYTVAGSVGSQWGLSVCPCPGSSTMCSPHANLSITLKHVVRGIVDALCYSLRLETTWNIVKRQSHCFQGQFLYPRGNSNSPQSCTEFSSYLIRNATHLHYKGQTIKHV
jgi:hypothetical protein